MRVSAYLEQLARDAITKAHESAAPAQLRAADPAHGDYQVNGVLALAKQLARPPRELAQPVAEALSRDPAIASAEVAGPGFINLRLSPAWLAERLLETARDEARDGVPAVDHPQRIVVDYSGPNIAKEMHVGHLRSTIIGAALARMLRFLGHDVLTDNHIGDWGTQFGLLIVGMRRFGDEHALESAPVQELERVYKLASAAAKAEPAVADQARSELAKLQQGDPANRKLWQNFVDVSRKELDKVYARLGITFDLWRGESAYEEALPEVVHSLVARGIAREDQGALCVFFEDDSELKGKPPFIVQKKDGAFLYSTTDIATVLYRKRELRFQSGITGAERALYVVDQRQKLHFQQLFATVKKLGIEMELEHVGFGSVTGKDGKPLKTRAGDVIKLSELLDESEARAKDLIQEHNMVGAPDWEKLRKQIGIGAIKYADLSQNRLSDYRFDWDKLITLKGNSGPYLQYAHARVASIFRKGGIDPHALDAASALTLEHALELELAKQLVRFADVVYEAAASALPHLLCEHLYALARSFSSFYEECQVLNAAAETRRSRLLLCWLTARQLARGLTLLGIDAPDRM